MTDKYYRTTYTLEVLSIAPNTERSLEGLNYEITEGHCSGRLWQTGEEEVSDEQMESLLEIHGTDPTFLLGDDWECRKEIKMLEFALETTGGRSIELAERIDELREQVE
tara:strand:- start:897 stop:1223 length:327 start_codon:yes stop_codon:yes gene_type:complete